MTDVLTIISKEVLYFQNYQIFIFPKVHKFQKFETLKTVDLLNSEVVYALRLKCMYVYMYVCIYACMLLCKHQCLCEY